MVSYMGSKLSIDFRAVLDAVNPDQRLRVIDPVNDAVVANAQFAEAGQIVRHPDEPAMDRGLRILGKPDNLALDGGADGGVQLRELRLGARAYFDAVGHET